MKPIAYINVEKRTLEFAEPIKWHTPTVANLDRIPLFTKEVLAQPEQEPVAWSYWQSCLNDDGTQTAPWVHRLSKFKPTESIINKDVTPLYTISPQRTWVGLTDEEIDSYFEDHGWSPSEDYYSVIKAIEAKLKEKNNA